MHCENCGKKLRRGESFCTVCGYYNGEANNVNDLDFNESLEDEPLVELTEEVEEEPKKGKKQGKDIEDKIDNFSKKSNASGESKDTYYYAQEEYLEYFIGEDYKSIKSSLFNIYAFLLNWLYVLYRKMYITGILGLVVTALVFIYARKYFIIYAAVVVILLGLLFNKIYIFFSKRKVEHIVNYSDTKDQFKLKKICEKKGGVNYIIPLICYAIFLAVIILKVFNFKVQKPVEEKFFKENSEGQASCKLVVKTAYKDPKKGLSIGKIDNAACKIINSKTYEVYMKYKNGETITYIYYKTNGDYLVYQNDTENITELQAKQADNTITPEEITLLSEKLVIKGNYEKILKDAQEEEKLVKEKKDTKPRSNYIYTSEQVVK